MDGSRDLGNETKAERVDESREAGMVRLVRDSAPMREITAKLKRHAESVRRMARTMNLVVKK